MLLISLLQHEDPLVNQTILSYFLVQIPPYIELKLEGINLFIGL